MRGENLRSEKKRHVSESKALRTANLEHSFFLFCYRDSFVKLFIASSATFSRPPSPGESAEIYQSHSDFTRD